MTDIKKKLQDEIAALEHELHVELPKEILKARAHGDLSENAEYHAAKDRQGFVNARLGQLKKRLSEVFLLVRDRIAHPDGFLTLFFTPDWRPIPDDDSYGHDVETAYLLTEAAEVLGMSADPTTRTVTRRLVDHALEVGWDNEHGGFYDKGPPAGKATAREKIWWIQAEGLNGLLLMHELYGSQTDRYYRAFLKQWSFIEQHVVDRKNGDWYATLDADGSPKDAHEEKGGKWKDPYHQGRALMECAERLHRLAERGAKR